jgi:hypothetical protein
MQAEKYIMQFIAFLETIFNASPAVAVFIIAVLALLIASQALAIVARSIRRDRSDDQ